MEKFITKTPQETRKLGARLVKRLKDGEILALYGDLGAGKTTLLQGLARGLGVTEPVQSPTFVLLNVYKIKSKILNLQSAIRYFVHVDAYRLKNAGEALALGLTDYLGRPDTVTVIEWAEKLEEILKNYPITKISLEQLTPITRKITLSTSQSKI